MTKRELIEALEALDCSDDTDVIIKRSNSNERLHITQVKLITFKRIFEDVYPAIRLG